MLFVEESFQPDYIEVAFKPVRYYIDRIKTIMGAKFNPDMKKWLVPKVCLDEFDELFQGEVIWITPRHELFNQPPPLPPSFWSDVKNNPIELKVPLYPFQNFGANFLAHVVEKKGFAMLGDLMGLGKTPQAIAASQILSKTVHSRKTFIICLSPLKIQWARDGVEKFTDSSALVIRGTPAQRKALYEQIDDYDYIITSYELVLKDIEILLSTQKINPQLDLLIVDEAHKLKNRAGKINHAVSELAKTIPYRIFLTGTPIMNRPEELFGVFQAAASDAFGKFNAFAKKHLNYQYNGRFNDLVGYRNLDNLRDTLAQYFLRRTDKEVDMDLPDKIEVNDYVEMTEFQRKLDKMIDNDYQIAKKKLDGMYKNNAPQQQIEAMKGAMQGYMNMRIALFDSPELFTLSTSENIRDTYGTIVEDNIKSADSPKLNRLVDIVEEIVDNNHKVIIFSQFKRMVHVIKKEIEKRLNVPVITYHGELDEKSRDARVQAFRNDKDYKIFVGTEAASTGLNLQISKYLINFDLPWNPAIFEQRKGRVRRIGSTHSSVKVINLLVKDSIDEQMYEVIVKKQNVFNALVENNQAQSEHLSNL